MVLLLVTVKALMSDMGPMGPNFGHCRVHLCTSSWSRVRRCRYNFFVAVKRQKATQDLCRRHVAFLSDNRFAFCRFCRFIFPLKFSLYFKGNKIKPTMSLLFALKFLFYIKGNKIKPTMSLLFSLCIISLLSLLFCRYYSL